MTKAWLSKRGISYTERNVSTDRDSLQSLVTMGYRSTPVTVIGDNKIVGYSPAKLEASLEPYI